MLGVIKLNVVVPSGVAPTGKPFQADLRLTERQKPAQSTSRAGSGFTAKVQKFYISYLQMFVIG
jgi:hypothetical protein